MLRFTPDVGKNRLVVEFDGRVSAAEFAQAEQALRQAVARLRVPYDVLSDVRKLESLESDPATLARLATLVPPEDVRHFVRVVGRSTESAVNIARATKHLGFEVHLAFSREEAETVFDASSWPPSSFPGR